MTMTSSLILAGGLTLASVAGIFAPGVLEQRAQDARDATFECSTYRADVHLAVMAALTEAAAAARAGGYASVQMPQGAQAALDARARRFGCTQVD